MMIVLAIGAGVAIGGLGMYFLGVKPLQEHIVRMRKQGFVPQFEFDYEPPPDPSRDIREY